MDARANTPRLPLDNIFHPSDFSAASEIAIAHALKLALAARATLRILHVSANVVDVEWADFPGIRRTLERWGVIPPGSSRSAVAKLGLRPKKILAPGEDPVDAILPYLRRRPADLIVLATHQRDWLGRWSHKAVAEPVARRSGAMTLFVPHEARGSSRLRMAAWGSNAFSSRLTRSRGRKPPWMPPQGLRWLSAAGRSSLHWPTWATHATCPPCLRLVTKGGNGIGLCGAAMSWSRYCKPKRRAPLTSLRSPCEGIRAFSAPSGAAPRNAFCAARTVPF